MTTAFWIEMIVYALSMGSFAGMILTRIGVLEKKIDQYSGLVERVVAVEQSSKSAHYRLDRFKKKSV